MKKSLREMRASPAKAEKTEPAAPSAAEIEGLIGQYAGRSEEELMSALLNETHRQKAEGRFDESSIQKGAEAILPFLSEGQKQKLYSILGKL